MKIELLSWGKFQTRKDLKSMPWFKIQSDIGYSETLFGLSAEQKWLWIFTLSTCARKISPEIEINIDYFSHNSGVKKEVIVKTMQIFENKGLVRILTDSERICTEIVHKKREEKKREEKKRSVFVFSENDLESIYALYPKKVGKKAGYKILTKEIDSKQKLHDLKKAVENYAHEVKNTERKFIKQFSTFAGCWEDYVDMEIEIDPMENWLNHLEEKANE